MSCRCSNERVNVLSCTIYICEYFVILHFHVSFAIQPYGCNMNKRCIIKQYTQKNTRKSRRCIARRLAVLSRHRNRLVNIEMLKCAATSVHYATANRNCRGSTVQTAAADFENRFVAIRSIRASPIDRCENDRRLRVLLIDSDPLLSVVTCSGRSAMPASAPVSSAA